MKKKFITFSEQLNKQLEEIKQEELNKKVFKAVRKRILKQTKNK
jgi:hypothetical protein